ncbi:MAG TPA: SDR family NAD(P)-dependent oxidoreductase, partial [Solirubrobacterales bacterium]
LSEAPLDELIAELQGVGVEVESVPADLMERDEAEGLVARAEDALGPIDILVNNAGLEFAGPFLERTADEIEGLTQVNLLALMLITRSAMPGMQERGRGHVVNIASLAGKVSFPYLATYGATKHGVVGFTASLRGEHGEDPVGFSAICPGFVSRVGMFGRLQERVGEPPGVVRTVSPEAVGEAVVTAIRRKRAEVIVQPGARPLILLSLLAPRTAARIGRTRRFREFAERFAREKGRAPRTLAEERAAPRTPD